jgi:hypothetical protein
VVVILLINSAVVVSTSTAFNFIYLVFYAGWLLALLIVVVILLVNSAVIVFTSTAFHFIYLIFYAGRLLAYLSLVGSVVHYLSLCALVCRVWYSFP